MGSGVPSCGGDGWFESTLKPDFKNTPKTLFPLITQIISWRWSFIDRKRKEKDFDWFSHHSGRYCHSDVHLSLPISWNLSSDMPSKLHNTVEFLDHDCSPQVSMQRNVKHAFVDEILIWFAGWQSNKAKKAYVWSCTLSQWNIIRVVCFPPKSGLSRQKADVYWRSWVRLISFEIIG